MSLLKSLKTLFGFVLLGLVGTWWIGCSDSAPVASRPAGKATCSLCEFLGDDTYTAADGQAAPESPDTTQTDAETDADSTQTAAETDADGTQTDANAHAYRAHALRRAGLSTKQIAAALGRSERSIRAYLATPFSTVQATRQRIVRPRPRPTLYPPAAAAICYLLIPPTKERSEKKTEPTDSKLPPPEEIDVLAELKTHWAAQDRQKSHHAPSRAPDKATPETKIVYAP